MTRATGAKLARIAVAGLGLALAVSAAPTAAGLRAAGAAPAARSAASLALAPVPDPQPPESTDPAQLTITGLEPRTIGPGDPVTVLARLTNRGTAPLAGLRVELRTGSRLVTRSALANADTDPPSTEHAAGGWVTLPGSLSVGRTLPIRYQTTTAALGLSQIGVYPAELAVQGTIQDPAGDTAGRHQVGSVRTYLPYFPDGVAAPTAVSWLIPLVDRPHRLTDDTFSDDQLAGELGAHGRLTNLLHVAQVADHAKVPFTLAVDPDLIDSVVAMRQGYRVQVGHSTVDGTGKQSAAMWMNELVGLTSAHRHMVIALPYGDVDTVAVVQVGLPSLAQIQRETITRLNAELRTTVTSQVAWPNTGLLTNKALDVVTRNQNAVILDPAALSEQPAGITQDATSPLRSAAGDAVGLIADGGLSRVLAESSTIQGGPRLAEQRYLAELAMITAEAPSVRRQVLIAPPHRWSPNPVAAAAMLVDTRTIKWLAAGTVSSLITAPPVSRGTLVYPADAPSIGGTQANKVRAVQAQVDDFRSALDNNAANTLLEPFTHALGRAASSAWQDDLADGAAFVYRLGARIVTLRRSVYIVQPDSGQYTLGGQHSALPLTAVNELPVPVQVRVRITSRSTGGLQAKDIGVVTLAARQVDGPARRVQLRIPVTLTRAGRLQVTAALTTPDGKPLSQPVPLQVQSTAYGMVALGITGAAFILLLLLVARRVYRRSRHSPDFSPAPAGSPAERAR